MVKVKVCGITNTDDAVFCSETGADALGFIFYKKSPRYIAPQRVKKIMEALDPFIICAGVFVNEDRDKVEEIADYLNLDVLQFHGKESPNYCTHFLRRFRVIKTFFPPRFPNNKYTKVNAYLFDIKFESKKKKKDVLRDSFLNKIKVIKGKMTILSGGLTPGNISVLIRKVRPYAVDVASGVEAFPGRKDKKLVKEFIEKVKRIEN